MHVIPMSVGNFVYFLKNIVLYMWGKGMKLLALVHGHGPFFKEFLHIPFFPDKFLSLFGEVDTGDFDDPDSLHTKRQKQR